MSQFPSQQEQGEKHNQARRKTEAEQHLNDECQNKGHRVQGGCFQDGLYVHTAG